MLVQLTVRSLNHKNVTAYTEAFESTQIQMLRDNQNAGAVPVINGTAEFVYVIEGRDALYTVDESVATITTAAGGSGFAANYGTVAPGVTVKEYGNGLYHQTVLTFDTFDKTIAGASLAHGKLGYTFPEGGILIHGGTFDITITGATETGTPDMGIGSVLGSTAVANISTPATLEDICNGAAGTAISSSGGQTVRVFRAEIDSTSYDGHTTAIPVYFNFALGWTASEILTIYPCIISLNWTFLGDV